jgi:hypothetical protein
MNEISFSQDLIQNVVIYLDSYLSFGKDSRLEAQLRNSKIRIHTGFTHSLDTDAHPVWVASSRSLEALKTAKGFKIYVKSPTPDFFEQEVEGHFLENLDLMLEHKEFEENFPQLLKVWFVDQQRQRLEKLTRSSNQHLKALTKQMKLHTKEQVESEGLSEIFDKFLTHFEEFYLSINYEALQLSVEKAQKKLFRKNVLQLKTLFEVVPKGLPHFYLGSYKGSHLFLEVKALQEDLSFTFTLNLFVSYLTRLLKSLNLKATEIKPAQILFEAFELLPMPIILTGKDNEVLNYNVAFGKLNLAPSTVSRYENFDEIKAKDQSWTIKKVSFQNARGESRLTIFFPKNTQRNRQFSSGSQDLGIITSSIAHELNNPIAGILAALEVLMMEDFLDDEVITELGEMKQSTLRCKQLVETFLGFSKVSPIQTERKSQLLTECFEQALNLQRFRMIESQLRINLSVTVLHPYSYPLHQPTVTMMAYLIMGELMTSFHHLRLLENKSAKGQVLELTLIEDADNFQVKLRPILFLSRDLSSKLLTYLMEQEKLSLSFTDDGSLVFTHKIMLI